MARPLPYDKEHFENRAPSRKQQSMLTSRKLHDPGFDAFHGLVVAKGNYYGRTGRRVDPKIVFRSDRAPDAKIKGVPPPDPRADRETGTLAAVTTPTTGRRAALRGLAKKYRSQT